MQPCHAQMYDSPETRQVQAVTLHNPGTTQSHGTTECLDARWAGMHLYIAFQPVFFANLAELAEQATCAPSLFGDTFRVKQAHRPWDRVLRVETLLRRLLVLRVLTLWCWKIVQPSGRMWLQSLYDRKVHLCSWHGMSTFTICGPGRYSEDLGESTCGAKLLKCFRSNHVLCLHRVGI